MELSFNHAHALPNPREASFTPRNPDRAIQTADGSKSGADGGAGNEKVAKYPEEKRGAAGITTAAPRIAGQWGRGDNRLPK
jgi:hypothetical protein